MIKTDFSQLDVKQLTSKLTSNNYNSNNLPLQNHEKLVEEWRQLQFKNLNTIKDYYISHYKNDPLPYNLSDEDLTEWLEVNWLIKVFNQIFSDKNVKLVRGSGEPEYLPAEYYYPPSCNKKVLNKPARIEFAHGFFSSALHEISHWCIAGKLRRTLPDFGYWYAPDGRSQAQQQAFEKVEIKPQALECLFTKVLGKKFAVSQDNLDATYDTNQSTFKQDVLCQAMSYINFPDTLPPDAETLLTVLVEICHDTVR